MGQDKPSPDKPDPSLPEEIKGEDPSPLPGPPPNLMPPQRPPTDDLPPKTPPLERPPTDDLSPPGGAPVSPDQNLTLEEKLDILAEKVRRRRNARQAPKILTQIDLPAVDESLLNEIKRKKPRRSMPAKLATEPAAPPAEPAPPPAAPAPVESPPEPRPKARKTKQPTTEVREPSDAIQIAELQATIVKLNEEIKSLKRKLSKKDKPPSEPAPPPAAGDVAPAVTVDPHEDEVSIALPDIDRRKYFRFKLENVKLAFFRVGLLEKLGVSRNIGRALVDISEGGCSAIIVREVDAYASVRVQVEMPKFKQSLELLGEVRWCSKLSRDLWEVGVVFTGMTPRDLGILRAWTQDSPA